MNYLDGRKCLDEILDSVTPEDEKTFFLNLEYLKDYNGVVIGNVHDDWFGNIFDVFLTKNTCADDDLYTWENFDEAKRNLEEKENPSSKCFHLKEGLKIGFEHEMVLSDCYPDNIPEPRWVILYNEWTKQKNAYKRRFMSDEDKENYSKFICNVIDGFQSAMKKNN